MTTMRPLRHTADGRPVWPDRYMVVILGGRACAQQVIHTPTHRAVLTVQGPDCGAVADAVCAALNASHSELPAEPHGTRWDDTLKQLVVVHTPDPDGLCGFCGDPQERCECSRPILVTPYRVTRHYGGPEEGGWWYDWQTPAGDSLEFVDTRAAREAATRLNDAQPDDRRFSVNDTDGDLRFIVERWRGQHATTERPVWC